MQVTGDPSCRLLACPRILSETAGRRRVFSRRRPQISKPRDDVTPWAMARSHSRRALRRAGRKSRRRSAPDPLSVGEEATPRKPQAASPAREAMDGRAGARRRGIAQRQPHVGQAQDRRAAAPRGRQDLNLDDRPHPRSSRGARRRPRCAGPAPQARREAHPPSQCGRAGCRRSIPGPWRWRRAERPGFQACTGSADSASP
jgi:hypothetical protein